VPIDINVQEPSSSYVQFVTDFAKQTGDIRSLSSTDIAVVALTYEIESRLNGQAHLRTSPVSCIKVNEGFGDEKVANLVGFYVPKSTSKSTSRSTSISSNIADGDAKTDTPDETSTQTPSCTTDDLSKLDTTPDLSHSNDTTNDLSASLDGCQLDEGWSTVPIKNSKSRDYVEEEYHYCDIDIPDDVLKSDCNFEEDCEDDYEISDNEEDWITPSNISEQQSKQLSSVRVACATTDFAMQNVLLQIGLNVVSVDGVLIKYAKTYVLKCTACFTVVKDCTKMFCTKCGNKTLEKVAVTVDDEGVTWYQRLSRKPKTGRGVRYSLPKPKGGRGSNMPWLTEDQPDKQMHSKVRCDVKSSVDVMSSDYAKSASPFGVTNVDTRAFRYHQTGGKHGNPNERSKRTGNRKKKKI